MPRTVNLPLALLLLVAPAAAQQPTATMPLSSLPLRLVGVAIDASAPARSAGLIQCGLPGEHRPARLVAVGDQACDLAVVDDVRADEVIVRNIATGRLERVTLSSAATTGAHPVDTEPEKPAHSDAEEIPAPVIVPTAPGVVTIELQRALVHRSLSNLAAVLTSALATPHRADGASSVIDGYEMTRITPGGIVDQLGIRDGDVLLDFNGQRLDNLGAVTSLLGRAESLEGARMTVLRSGAPLMFIFKVQ